jgi:hypothetical protein
MTYISRAATALASLLVGIFLLIDQASADSWAPPEREAYFSENEKFRLTVTPRDIMGPVEYFKDRISGVADPGQDPGSDQTSAHGHLERVDRHGQWTTVWQRDLPNIVAPVSAIISNSGRYVATFDDWHAVGTGEHVVVIYGPDGSLIRSFQLSDLISEDYIFALPSSVSSIDWGGKHQFSSNERFLELQIGVPSEDWDMSSDQRDFVTIRFASATGKFLSRMDWAWAMANARAQITAETIRATLAAERAAFIAPLLAPPTLPPSSR